MSLADRLKTAEKVKGANVLILDIERMKGTAHVEFWDMGDFKNRRLHADTVVEWPRNICAAWQWYGTKPVEFAAEWLDGGADAMHARIWDAYDRADLVVGHNLAGFDTKKLKTAWRDMGLNPPSPWKTFDTLSVARREFGDESKTLDALCKRMGITAKTDRYDVEVARAACAGNKAAQRQIKGYNVGDIHATTALYNALRGWSPTHPHNVVGTANDRPTCNQCWGDNLERNGTVLAQQITYVLLRCTDCGANVKGTMHSRAAITRGAA